MLLGSDSKIALALAIKLHCCDEKMPCGSVRVSRRQGDKAIDAVEAAQERTGNEPSAKFDSDDAPTIPRAGGPLELPAGIRVVNSGITATNGSVSPFFGDDEAAAVVVAASGSAGSRARRTSRRQRPRRRCRCRTTAWRCSRTCRRATPSCRTTAPARSFCATREARPSGRGLMLPCARSARRIRGDQVGKHDGHEQRRRAMCSVKARRVRVWQCAVTRHAVALRRKLADRLHARDG